MLKTVSSISNVIGALNYKGTWNASSNVPVLSSGVGTKGDYYVVSTAGSTNLDGTTLWGVGDWAVFNGSIWQKVDGGDTSAVTSLTVTGLTGYMYANGSNLVTASSTIPNSGLANSNVIINGTTINLGGSGTVTANTTGILTLGTGLSGTSFNGSINVTASLSNTTVTAGSYGTANSVSTITVNAQGQLTAASNTTIAIDAAAIATGTLAVARGGTNIASYTIGDLIYASGTTTLAKLPDVAVGSVVVSGGVGTAPSYSATPTVTSLTATTSLTSPIHNSTTTLSLQTGATTGLYIDASQNVGIGTTSPTSFGSTSRVLQVQSSDATGYGSVLVGSGTYTMEMLVNQNSGVMSIGSRSNHNLGFATNDTVRATIDTSGNLLVGTTTSPTYALLTAATSSGGRWEYGPSKSTAVYYVIPAGGGSGVYLSSGNTSWSSNSDERLKNITGTINDAVQSVGKLRAVKYTWNADDTNTPNVGLIAQDVLAVLPEAVTEDRGFYGVKYNEVIPLLVAAIQELSVKNDALEDRLSQLEAK